MRLGWVLGWAVPAEWFLRVVGSALPDAEHVPIPAYAGFADRLKESGPFDHVVGYSLGSLLLLEAWEGGALPACAAVSLLAPIFAFPAEDGLGGRVARAQVRQLSRWLRRDAGAAIEDFYIRAGLDVPASERPGTAAIPDLLWGLERLASVRVPPSLPAGWRGWCGDGDPLLDASRLHALVPGISVVAGAGHHPEALVRAWVRDLGA